MANRYFNQSGTFLTTDQITALASIPQSSIPFLNSMNQSVSTVSSPTFSKLGINQTNTGAHELEVNGTGQFKQGAKYTQSSNLITIAGDSDFTIDTGNWIPSGLWVIAGGKYTHTAGVSNIVYDALVLPTTTYKVKLSIETTTTGSITLGSNATFDATLRLEPAILMDVYVYLRASNKLNIITDALWEGSLLDIEIYSITENGPAINIVPAPGVRVDINCTDYGGTFIGDQSGLFNNKFYDTAIGYHALRIGGGNCTAVGADVLSINTEVGNTAVGSHALSVNILGQNNTALGLNALTSCNSGNGNIAVGVNSMPSLLRGSNNISIGTNSSNSIINGSRNIIIGAAADTTSDTTNSISIGYGNGFMNSNYMYLGNSGITNTIIRASATTEMTGDCKVAKYLSTNAGLDNHMFLKTSDSNRFSLGLESTESGGNAGSNLVISSYDDNGSLLSLPLRVHRSTGNVLIGSSALFDEAIHPLEVKHSYNGGSMILSGFYNPTALDGSYSSMLIGQSYTQYNALSIGIVHDLITPAYSLGKIKLFNGTEAIAINGLGSVGIGVNPIVSSEKLEVNGNILVDYSKCKAGLILGTNSQSSRIAPQADAYGISFTKADLTTPIMSVDTANSTVNVNGTSESTSSTTGALLVSGGVGIAKDLYARNITSQSLGNSTITVKNITGGAGNASFSLDNGTGNQIWNIIGGTDKKLYINDNTGGHDLMTFIPASTGAQVQVNGDINFTRGRVTKSSGSNYRAYMSLPALTVNKSLNTWSTRPTAADNEWVALSHHPSTTSVWAVSKTGVGNRSMRSTNSGTSWTTLSTVVDNDWTSVCFSTLLSLFCAVSSSGTNNRAITIASNGANWTVQTTPNNDWRSVCYSPELELFVAVASSGSGDRVMTSPDGVTWTSQVSAADNDWYSVCWSVDLGLLCAVASSGSGNRVMTSPDGIVWTIRASALDHAWKSICWSLDLQMFVVVSDTVPNNKIMYSYDGINWGLVNAPSDTPWKSVAWLPNLNAFVACGNSGVAATTLMSSFDGLLWVNRPDAGGYDCRAVVGWPSLGSFGIITASGTGDRHQRSMIVRGITSTLYNI
jgi:hypothetical protein